MSKKVVPNRRDTAEFKVDAARLTNFVGHNKAARRFGVPVAAIGIEHGDNVSKVALSRSV